eukprot:93845-Prorocentrum_minimum.AAC.3
MVSQFATISDANRGLELRACITFALSALSPYREPGLPPIRPSSARRRIKRHASPSDCMTSFVCRNCSRYIPAESPGTCSGHISFATLNAVWASSATLSTTASIWKQYTSSDVPAPRPELLLTMISREDRVCCGPPINPLARRRLFWIHVRTVVLRWCWRA